MKHVLLLGATGTAGNAITKKLLSDTECHVTLFARHAEDMFSDSPRTTVVNGDAEQIENLKEAMQGQAVDIVEASDLNYTVLRPGYLKEGGENDFVLSAKGEPAKGYITTIPSLVKLAVQLISDETLYARESVSITRDTAQKNEEE